MEIQLLKDIFIIFALSIVVIFICHRIKVPAVVGFLLTGILAGPHVLGLIKGAHEIEILAEIGVILLLFTIGIEFSLKNLLQIKKSVLLGGSLQVVLTLVATFFIARNFGLGVGESIFAGFLISLSSTAIVLKLMQERCEVVSPHGRTSLAILIFQDIIIVPMILITPILAGVGGGLTESMLILLAKGVGIIILVFVSSKWIVPWILYQVAKTKSRELFLMSVIVICITVAWLTSASGLSLALGAFLAGLIISESEYANQAFGNILPFRDVFTSLFFVSIGMLFNVNYFIQNPVLIFAIAIGVIVLKTFIGSAVTLLLGFPFRTTLLVGLAISQIGEFSFILSKFGTLHNLINENIYQMFLSVSVLTMAATPFIIALAPRLADSILRIPMPKKIKLGLYPIPDLTAKNKKDHLIIIGFGINGKNVARAAKVVGVPYVIIEMNPQTVRKEQKQGEPIYYGDATMEATLLHADIIDAKVMVISIAEPTSIRRITQLAKRLNPKTHIIVRTRFLQEMKPLYDLGANEVIPEEFETSVEIFARVLAKYLIPKDEIHRLVAEVRADGYEMFRSLSPTYKSFWGDLKLELPGVEISALKISEKSSLIGKSLAEIELRKKYGVAILAIRREAKTLANPSGDERFSDKDVLFVLGAADKIAELSGLV